MFDWLFHLEDRLSSDYNFGAIQFLKKSGRLIKFAFKYIPKLMIFFGRKMIAGKRLSSNLTLYLPVQNGDVEEDEELEEDESRLFIDGEDLLCSY